ncbi:unnamed protein product [Adineta steineri]|uniref:Nephrocystin 3-like N-terminal domain-containing protein n=2 Tax=Adineta steineri TaxID=433720 RepID=A0A819VI07_9BILA|nr:unnamed protein product [Adineta steineri]
MEEAIQLVKKSYPPACKEIPVKYLFLSKYGQFPQNIRLLPVEKEKGSQVVFHVKTVLDRLNDQYSINNELPIIRRYFHQCSKKYYTTQQVVSLSNINGILIHLNQCHWVTNYTNNSNKSIEPDYVQDGHYLVVEQIYLFYLNEHENFVQKLAHDLIHDDTLSLIQPKVVNLCFLGKYKDTCNGPGSFYTRGNTLIKKPYINNLAVSYGGHDFLRAHNKIVTWLNKKDTNGLVLLHGAPGSGKTHYIRYLLNCIVNTTEKSIIYFPADMINELTNPALLLLLIGIPNSLLVIEDAESSLTRTRASSQAVSNLLNLSDGLLSDGIHIQILATFNCPLESLDVALLRPGRLVVQYCFPATLSIENARHLAESIGVSNIDQINQPLPLANVYAMKDEIVNEQEQDEGISFSCRKCSSSKYCDYDGEEE